MYSGFVYNYTDTMASMSEQTSYILVSVQSRLGYAKDILKGYNVKGQGTH